MVRKMIPNGGSSITRSQSLQPREGRYIAQRTVPTLQVGLTKMFSFINVVLGILFVANGIGVIIIRAGNYKIGAGIWGGALVTSAGLVGLMTGSRRKKVVIGCMALTSVAIVAVFAAGIVCGTGIQVDDAIMLNTKHNANEMKARIGLNCVGVALAIASFFASLFVVYLCGRALDDAASVKDIDVSKLYPSRLPIPPMDGITNPVYVEEHSRGASHANGAIKVIDTKEPILLVPLKEKHADTISISYDLTDSHNQTCRIARHKTPDSSERGSTLHQGNVCREIIHTPPENDLAHVRNEYWQHEADFGIERPLGEGRIHRNGGTGGKSDFTVLDTIDAKRAAGHQDFKDTGAADDYDYPEITHWNTLASLEMSSESSHGFSDIVNMTPDSGSNVSSHFDENQISAPHDTPDEDKLRAFSKQFVDNICQEALREVRAEHEVDSHYNDKIRAYYAGGGTGGAQCGSENSERQNESTGGGARGTQYGYDNNQRQMESAGGGVMGTQYGSDDSNRHKVSAGGGVSGTQYTSDNSQTHKEGAGDSISGEGFSDMSASSSGHQSSGNKTIGYGCSGTRGKSSLYNIITGSSGSISTTGSTGDTMIKGGDNANVTCGDEFGDNDGCADSSTTGFEKSVSGDSQDGESLGSNLSSGRFSCDKHMAGKRFSEPHRSVQTVSNEHRKSLPKTGRNYSGNASVGEEQSGYGDGERVRRLSTLSAEYSERPDQSKSELKTHLFQNLASGQ